MSKELSNYNLCKMAIEIKKDLERNFLELGEYLFKIREGRMYEPSWTSFDEYLEELNMSESVASKLIKIYQRFVLEYNIEQKELVEAGGWTKLYYVLPLINNKKEASEWVHKCSILSQRDIIKEVKEEKTGILMKECDHGDTFKVEICKDCGDKRKI